jgi:hypothetical protein
MISKLDLNKVKFKIHDTISHENYLKYNILKLNNFVFSYDNGDEYGYFPCFIFEENVIIGNLDNCLLICFLEFILNKFGKNYYFMWENSNEGFDPVKRTTYDNINLFSKLKQFYKYHNIDEKLFIYHGGNLTPHNYSELNYTNLYHIFMWHENNFVKKEFNINKTFEKKFIFLNRVAKNERIFLYENLNKSVLENSFYSINSDNDIKYHISKSIENEIVLQNDVWKTNINSFFENSFCNIITESEYWSDGSNQLTKDCILFTEKTAKAFINYQPFVLVGCYNSLKYLKSLGFKTFDSWWDESYDNIYDDKERLNAIVKTIETINSFSNQQIYDIYKEINSNLIHNNELFWKFKNKQTNIKTFFPYPFSDMDCFWKI